MKVEIEETFHEVVIQIEHKSEREDVSMRIYEYLCYAWLLKKRPVWSIVIYTDDAIISINVWDASGKEIPDSASASAYKLLIPVFQMRYPG